MDDTETPTLSPPEGPPSTDEAVVQDETAPVSEPAPLEEVEAESPSPPAWASVQEAEELLDLEDVKPIIKRREQAAGDRAYERVKGDMQHFLLDQHQTLAQIATATESIQTTLNRAAEDGVLDKRTVEDLMRTHRNEFAALNQTHQATGYWEGVKQYTQALLGDSAPPFVSRLEGMATGVKDPTFATDLQKKVREAGRKEGYDEGYRKGSKEGKNAATAQTAIKENKGVGANLAPGTSGSAGRPTPEQWAAMSTVDRNKARAEGRGPTD